MDYPGKAARDETAFKHALKTGHRLRQQGQRLTDAAIIHACAATSPSPRARLMQALALQEKNPVRQLG